MFCKIPSPEKVKARMIKQEAKRHAKMNRKASEKYWEKHSRCMIRDICKGIENDIYFNYGSISGSCQLKYYNIPEHIDKYIKDTIIDLYKNINVRLEVIKSTKRIQEFGKPVRYTIQFRRV